MSSVIESEIPQPGPACCYCEEEETCRCEGEAVCCQYEGCACQAANQKVELNDIVKVVFLDHAQDLGEPLVCTVYGLVEHIDNIFINITSWHPVEHSDDDENKTTYTVIRSCIRQLYVLN